MKFHATLLRSLLPATMVAGLLATPVAAFDEPAPVVASDVPTNRYIVEFEPGAVPVVVKADHPDAPEIARDATAEAIADDVVSAGGAVVYDYDTLPFVAVETDDVSAVWSMPGVVNVQRDEIVRRTLDESLEVIEATEVDLSAAIGGLAATGAGHAVAIIDDGVDRTHPFLQADNDSKVVAEACFTAGFCPGGTSTSVGTGSAAPRPGRKHGTHVAGIAVGNGRGATTPKRGVASESSIVAVQVFSTCQDVDRIGNPETFDCAFQSDIDAALLWVLSQAASRSIPVVNLSLGGSTFFQSNCDGIWASTKEIVDDLSSAGVVVVVASGNAGRVSSLPFPACLSNVIAVGATDDNDQIALFSNVSQQLRDTGVMAPGVAVMSSVTGGGFESLQGTSMAAPMVSGAVALLKQAKPTATPAEIRSALRTTSTLVDDTPNGGVVDDLPRLNVWQAIGSLLPQQAEVSGTVEDSGASPVAVLANELLTVVVDPADQSPSNQQITTRPLTSPNGTFRLRIPVGNWMPTVSMLGFAPVSGSNLQVASDVVADLGMTSLQRRTGVASVSPTEGPVEGGTPVTIRGRHLTGATGIRFGSQSVDPTTVTVVNDTTITVTTPPATAGSARVTVETSLGESTDLVDFSYMAPPPPPPPPSGGGVPAVGGGGGGGGAPSPATRPIEPSPTGQARTTASFSFGTVSLALTGVSGAGDVVVTPKAGKPTSDSGGVIIPGYWLEITTTIGAFGRAEICAPIETGNLASYNLTVNDLRLFHWENGVRTDITERIDTVNNRVCGTASSFSPFAVGALQTDRQAGLDRFETAVEVSKDAFDPGVDVVFVVTGEKFPDALAAGAAAGRLGGPVLLTRFGSLPTSTRAELQRLKPKRVLVVGGPAVISDVVVGQVQTAVGSVSVKRVWGVDRFETSVQLSMETVAVAVGTVYIGSGLGFTEILSASAAAGRDNAPLLLVPGTGPNAGVPLGVAVELARLRPTKIVVVGGSMLVAPQIVDRVKALVPSAAVTQVGGADAYDTASKLARTFSPGGTVYVATGEVFADGLAGGAVAAVTRSAMVMVPPSGSLQSTVRTALSTLQPRRIIVLGGPAAIDYDVENAIAKYLPS